MTTKRLALVQDSRQGPLNLSEVHSVIYGVGGDSNGIGFDTTAAPADWSVRLPSGEYPTDGQPEGVGVWNKWTVGPNAARASDVDSGTDWHQADAGLFDHGAGTYRGLGQIARGNGPETSIGAFMRASLLATGGVAGQDAPDCTVDICKYGVSGSVLHPAPASAAGGWHPTGAATGAFNIFTTRYLRPGFTHRIDEEEGVVYYGGTFFVCTGTDAIDPGGVFTGPDDAANYGLYLNDLLEGINSFMGTPFAPFVLGIPPFVQENAASNLGYPNIEMIRSAVRQVAKDREAKGRRTIAVDLGDIERFTDGLHYTNWAQWINGRRLAKAMIASGHLLHRIDEAP